MEEFLDPYLSFPSWTDENLNERSWAATEFNPLLPISTGLSQNDEESPSSMISSLSTQNPEALAAQDDSSLVSGVDCGEQMGCENFDNNPVKWFPNGRVVFGNLNLQRNEAAGVFSTSVSFAQDGSFEITDSNSCPFGTPLGELETLSPVTAYWSLPPSECTSSLSTLMGENERQSSHFQEGTAEDAGHVGKYAEFDDILQPGKLLKGQQGLRNCTTDPFAAGPQITNNQIIQSLPQMVPTTSKGDANGVGKPRIRARRGQATDPHSIAERLRRERISERMKNLQELVPNSSKTDKASMLDKIIEYVKFLQLEVKVLSMSRFGAAGAVVPLFTDGPAELSDGLSFSPWAGREPPEFSPSPEHTALEQEVVKLMESNVTSAMQYLQNKGLCLIPVALAATISSGKASSTSCNSKQMKKSGCTNGLSRNSRHSTSSDSNNNAHGMDSKAKQRSSVSRLPL